MDAVFLADVEDGKIKIRDRNALDQYLAGQSGEVIVRIGKRKKDRSDRQNRYYWGVLIKLGSEHFGYYPDEMHDALKIKFLTIETLDKPTRVASTARLTSAEFSQYVDRCRLFLEESGITVPDPFTFYENKT